MSRPPRLGRLVLRVLLPRHEIADALEGDLEEEYAGRRRTEGRARAGLWYLRQMVTLPWLRLRRRIRRLEARAPSGLRRGGGGMGGRIGGWMTDTRVAARSLLRQPAFAGVAIGTLALSIGAATLLYSVVDGVLLRPLPYERPDELVTVYLTSDEWRDSDNEILRAAWNAHTVRLDHVEAWRAAGGPLTGVAGYTYRDGPLVVDGVVGERAEAIFVDDGVFDVLGVAPALGRLPTDDEIASAAPVAVLRHETWQTRFGGAPDVLGRGFEHEERSYTVIGVMPPGFFFPTDEGGDLWVPPPVEARGWPSYYAVARLAPGFGVEDATAFLERTARRVGEENPERAGFGAHAVSHLENLVGQFSNGIRLLFATAMLVVIVACVNLANLFLARTAARREELAVRASLGAGTGSLAAAIFAEIGVIGLLGGGIGVAIAVLALDPFIDVLATSLRQLPRRSAIDLNGGVLLFSLVATTTTALLAGLAPVLGAARSAPADALSGVRGSSGGRGTRRVQRVFVAVQSALTVVALVASALLARSLMAAGRVEMGIDAGRVSVLEVRAPDDRLAGAPVIGALRDELRRRVAAIPEVSAAGVSLSLPGQGGVLLGLAGPEGAPAEELRPATTVTAGRGYFTSLGIPILAGRDFDEDPATRVDEVIVSEALAVELFGEPDPVGRRVELGTGSGSRTAVVVGVVGETRQLSVFQPPSPMLYRPTDGVGNGHFYLTARVDGDPGDVLPAMRATVLAAGAELTVERASTLSAMLRDGLVHLRLRLLLMAGLAGLAGALAMFGIGGVVAHYLSQQRREVGIRLALGAAAGREVGRVVRHVLLPTAVGLGGGVALAYAGSRVMESFVFGIETTDPASYAGAATLLLVTATLTAWMPARRTARIDPAQVLKRDG